MSTLSDSDDSDNDFLSEERAFAKPEPVKQEKTSLKILEQIAKGEQPIESQECSSTQESSKGQHQRKRRKANKRNKAATKKAKQQEQLDKKQELLRAERHNDPEWAEEQARKTVNEVLRLDIVDKITDSDDIGWHRCPTKKGKKADYYPAIISRNTAESKILLEKKAKKNYKTVRIQYIGVDWKDALKHYEIAFSNWISCSSRSESENEEFLRKFVKTISSTSRFKNSLVDLKIEEFAVRKMWEKVKIQQEKRRLEIENDREDAVLVEATLNLDSSEPSIRAAKVTQDSDNSCQSSENEKNADSDGSTDDDDDDDDNYSLQSPENRRKTRTALRVNDEIEYYDVMGTFGNPRALRRAKIDGIKPNRSFPLVLSNTVVPLPKSHRVRRLPGGCWQPIHEFVLVQEGVQSLMSGSGIQKATTKMKQFQADIIKARDRFWKNEHKTTNEKEPTKEEDDDEEKAKDNRGITNDGDLRLRRSRRSAVRSRFQLK